MKDLWITLYTDAGFKNGQGTWGAWIRPPNERIIRNGVCHEKITDANLAEMYAILAGVILILRTYPDLKIRGILVKSDSRTAIQWTRYGAPMPRDPAAAKMRTRLYEMLDERECHIRCVWVKGHRKPSLGISAYLNGAVDGLASLAREGPSGLINTRHRIEPLSE